jgi:hypothetical protein
MMEKIMELRIFDLPTPKDDTIIIERRWCELNTKFRNGDTLDEVEINWMDSANSWLTTTRN